MSIFKDLSFVIGLMLIALVCYAEESVEVLKPMREAGKFETVWKSKVEIRLVSQEKVKLTLPPVPMRAGVDTILSLRCRLDTSIFPYEGWNNYLAVWINGRPVNAVDDLVRIRLLNRPNPYNDKVLGAGQSILGNQLNTFFSPSFDKWPFQLKEPVQETEKYWFILRVEDLLYSDRQNIIELQNTAKFRDFGAHKAEDIVVSVDPLEIGYFQKPVPKITRQIELTTKNFKPEVSLKKIDSILEVNKFGGIKVSYNKCSFTMESSFSCPNFGQNWFSGSLNKSQNEWLPSVQKKQEKIVITAEGKQHKINRVIELLNNRIDFYDTIENKTSEILPVMVFNTIGLEKSQESVWVSGMPGTGSVTTRVDCQNPTVFVNVLNMDIGIYAKDTVLRNQFWLESTPYVITFGTKELGIAPKSSYTLRWRIYLSKDRDYFSFINSIRKDDDLNYTILGPFEWLSYMENLIEAKAEDIRKRFAIQSNRIGVGEPWYGYGNYKNPYSYNKEKYKELSQKTVENVINAVPGFMILVGREIAFYTAPKKVVDEHSSFPHLDSVIKNEDGSYRIIGESCPVPESVYIYAYSSLDNSYHKKLMDDVDFFMDECGFKGIYFDVFTQPGTISYDRWDGHSVEIDPKTFALVRTKNNVPILMGPAQSEMVKKILTKGGVVVCNQSSTSEEMQFLPVLSFVEGIYNATTTHLYSPIVLCNMWTNFTNEEQKKGSTLVNQITQRLKSGTLMYYYASFLGLGPSEYESYQILTNSFPITPIGLHAGWIEGKERIITAIPGKFVWRREDKPEVLVWNKDGRRVYEKVSIKQEKNTWIVDLTKLPKEGVGIIKKSPPIDITTVEKGKNLIKESGFETTTKWYSSGEGFEIDKGNKHSGKNSLHLKASKKYRIYGAETVIKLDGTIDSILLGGWYCSRGVGGRSLITADIHYKNGTVLPGLSIIFPSGDNNWINKEKKMNILPDTIDYITVIAELIYSPDGEVWFDDIYMKTF